MSDDSGVLTALPRTRRVAGPLSASVLVRGYLLVHGSVGAPLFDPRMSAWGILFTEWAS